MKRCEEHELLDGDGVDAEARARAYRELDRLHQWLGNRRAVLKHLRDEPASKAEGRDPAQIRVLDIGCGQGALLAHVHRQLGFDVVGFDLRPAPANSDVAILAGNAVSDPLPRANVAMCMMMAHHLSETELSQMIVNVSRTCKRFLIIDLVRHRVPLALFRFFVRPFLSPINSLDGQMSIRRAYTREELGRIVREAAADGQRSVRSIRHTVGPLWIRQVVDIRWEDNGREHSGRDGALAATEGAHAAAGR